MSEINVAGNTWARETTARKQHLCYLCQQPIPAGSRYYFIRHYNSGLRTFIHGERIHLEELDQYRAEVKARGERKE